MASKGIALLLAILLLIIPSLSAFNITRILENFPDFSTYNAVLSKTGLAATINSRRTITVLVVDNSAIGALDSIPIELAKRILSVHTILDYYDPPKLKALKDEVTSVVTLYQTTGDATQFRGFLNITKSTITNDVQFGSATPGSRLNADFVKLVVSSPYNISVLQVSEVIIPPGIEQSVSNSPPAATSSPPPATTANKTVASDPAASQNSPPLTATKEAAAPGPSTVEEKTCPRPTSSAAATPDASELATVADTPAGAPATTADAPAVSGPAPAETPIADEKVEDDAPTSSAGQIAATARFGMLTAMAAAVAVFKF